MGWILSRRIGFSHERFAQYVMGKISFIMTPDTIGDDVGFDMQGFFLSAHPKYMNQVIPGLAFVMQVKGPSFKTGSNSEDRDYFQKRIRELSALKVPYYVCIPNQEKQHLDIYSGIGLTALFSLMNIENLVTNVENGTAKIRVELKEDFEGFPLRMEDGTYILTMFKVATLNGNTGYDSPEMIPLVENCELYTKNISSFMSGEFAFRARTDKMIQFFGIGAYAHAVRRFIHSSHVLTVMLDERADQASRGGFNNAEEILDRISNAVLAMEPIVAQYRSLNEVAHILDDEELDLWTWVVDIAQQRQNEGR